MGKFKRLKNKLKSLSIDPMMAIAYSRYLPEYLSKGEIKVGDWCAVAVVSAREGLCMGLLPCKDAEDALAKQLIFESSWDGISEYVGSAAIRVDKLASGKGIEVIQVQSHIPLHTRMIGPAR